MPRRCAARSLFQRSQVGPANTSMAVIWPPTRASLSASTLEFGLEDTEHLFYTAAMAKVRNQRPVNVDYYRRNREREHARIRIRQFGQLELLRDLRRVPC